MSRSCAIVSDYWQRRERCFSFSAFSLRYSSTDPYGGENIVFECCCGCRDLTGRNPAAVCEDSIANSVWQNANLYHGKSFVTVTLRNPHSVLAALQYRPHDVLEIVTTANPSSAWSEVLEQARVHRIPFERPCPPVVLNVPASGKDRGGKFERQSSSEATVRDRAPLTVEQLFELAPPGPLASKSDAPGGVEGNRHGIWLALDCLQDPHNVGAVFRAAAFFGVRGIIATRDRSAPLSGTAYDVSGRRTGIDSFRTTP